MELTIALTVDCDLRRGTVVQRNKSLMTLMELFESYGLNGHITWFLNQNDFSMVEYHSDFIDKIVSKGATVGVHDHFDRFDSIHSYKQGSRPVDMRSQDEVLSLCGFSKDGVDNYLKKKGYSTVKLHRNGCLVQTTEIYRALKELGYTVVSDTIPGYLYEKGINGKTDRIGRPHPSAAAGKDIPLSVQPYRHDPENWTAYNSSEGHFFQVPCHFFGYSMNFEHLHLVCEKGKENQLNEFVFGWLFHPYEIQETDGDISPEKVENLSSGIRRLLEDERAAFTGINELL